MAEADALVAELNDFRVKITAAANETFAAADERRHDDLVLSVALACWYAVRQPRWPAEPFSHGEPGLMSRMPAEVALTGAYPELNADYDPDDD